MPNVSKAGQTGAVVMDVVTLEILTRACVSALGTPALTLNERVKIQEFICQAERVLVRSAYLTELEFKAILNGAHRLIFK